MAVETYCSITSSRPRGTLGLCLACLTAPRQGTKLKAMARTKKEITNDDLAQMMQNEFAVIHGEFAKNNQMHQLFVDRFDRIDSDIKDIKGNLGPLFKMVSMQEEEISDIRLRLARVERKVGIKE